LDVDIDGVRDGLVCAARFVLVDHGRPLTVVAHPCHKIPQARAAGCCERVSGVSQVVEVQAWRPDCGDSLWPSR
jgi:hypothetical protein